MKQTIINKFVKDRDAMNKDNYRLIYVQGLPFKVVKRHFKKALESFWNCDRGYQCLTYNEAWVTYLHNDVERIDKVDLEKYKEWSRTCCILRSYD